ncbi:FecR family protein [Pedobacter fastidiosus]|uniref:FecR domain-containing protein n=1 Tax=Pedobacter fastidiosus TaxID=2765361 RepID=A0ABR7KRW6_9SPHI|nr:FecR family protein [Pedobacter fastidiosus]MBC6110807.1 FecR domain-containing protein [Pedobacter fastidiosus]
MEKNSLKPELFKKFIAEKSNAGELEQLFSYFGNADRQELENLIKSEFENTEKPLDVAGEERLNDIRAELSLKLFAKPENKALRLVKSINFFRIAAAVLLFSFVAFFALKFSFKSSKVVSGSAKASLSLNGKQIRLGIGKPKILLRAKGVTVSTKADGTIVFMAVNADSVTASKLNTLTTPIGGEYRIALSDGSIVMLNAGSKLTFPTGFRGAERKVYVEGEAFFNVAKNPLKPFIVSVAGNEIKVLGTQFNVSSYPEDEGTETTLLEGSVKFSNSDGAQVILKPNQQVYAHYGKLDLRNVSADDFNAWTKGEFLFNDVSLATVMQKIARWYNVEVDAEHMPKKNLYIRISRKADIDEVLKVISKATSYEFDLSGNKIVIKE